MARNIGSLNFQGNDFQKARAHYLAAAPSSPVDGQLYFNSTDHTMYVYDSNATTWYSTRGTGVSYGSPSASAVGDTSSDGVATSVARSDHRHAREGFGAVTAQTAYGSSSANGSASTVARSDHTHGTVALTSATPSTQAIGDTAVVGTGTAPAREDHKHAMPSFGAVTAQTAFGAASANGSAATIARSDHVHGTPTHVGSDHSSISISSLSAPTGSVSWGSQKITNLLDPTSAQDAATKAYVDSVAAGLDPKASVRLTSTANVSVTYSATGGTSGRGQITAAPNTLDGVSLAAGNRILLKDQTTGAQNGIWVVSTLGTGANGVWDRATDFDQDAEVTSGAYVFVEEGSTNDNSGWVLTTNNPITIGGASGTAIAFAQFSGAGQITAGAGLTKTGNTLDVGQGTGITVNADTIQVDRTTNGGKVALIYAVSIGDGTNSTYTVTHNLGSLDVIVLIYENSGGAETLYDVVHATTNTVTVNLPFVATSNQLRVVVMG